MRLICNTHYNNTNPGLFLTNENLSTAPDLPINSTNLRS